MPIQQSGRYSVEKEDRSSQARTARLMVGDRELTTPILWLGHRVGGEPKPWQAFQLPGVLMNAWDILASGRAAIKVREAGLSSYLGLDRSSAVLLDSGGYLYLKRDDMEANLYEILELYEDLVPMIGAVLDYPFDPFDPVEVNVRRWRQTLENVRLMFGDSHSLTLMPIIHAHSVTQAQRACTELRQILGQPVVLGIGSLVPLMRGRHDGEILKKDKGNHQSGRHLAAKIVRVVRTEFPDSFLHVFGVGGTTTMHIMFALGADSLDSVGWRLKAAYGAIQLPGLGDRLTGKKKRKGRTLIIEDDRAIEMLLQCQCPLCRQYGTLEQRLAALDDTFNNRALHNAWVFVQEVALFREQIEMDSVESFVYQRLQRSPLKSLLPIVFD